MSKHSRKPQKAPALPAGVTLTFPENTLLPMLFGEHDAHLQRIEKTLGLQILSRGNSLTLVGEHSAQQAARDVLESLYQRLEKGGVFTTQDLEGALRMATSVSGGEEEEPITPMPSRKARSKLDVTGKEGDLEERDLIIQTRRKTIAPYSMGQKRFVQSIYDHELVLAAGPAGTGKTYLSVAVAVEMFLARRVERIILSRPAVEAGERLGFLPGDLKDKVDPYLRPLYDALYDMLPDDRLARHMEAGDIEVAPLAFMRGRTLANAFIILDEAQNATPIQMKMFLTRLGENARMVVTGDLSQVDLPPQQQSGLRDALEKLSHVDGVGIVRFTQKDVVRHPLVERVLHAYDRWEETPDE